MHRRVLEPAQDNGALPSPDDETKEDAREDQVRNVLAVHTRNRRRARLETNRRRRRRQSRTRRDDDDQGADGRQVVRRGIKAKHVRNDSKGNPRDDLIDDGLGAIAARNDGLIRTDGQNRKDQLRNDERHDQKRKERLRTRRTANRLQELVRNLIRIGIRNLGDLGSRVIDSNLGHRRTRIGTHKRRDNLGSARNTARLHKGTHLL